MKRASIKISYFTGHSVLETYVEDIKTALKEAQKLSLKYGKWSRAYIGDSRDECIEFVNGIIK